MEKKLTEGPVDPFGMENEMEKGKPKVSVVIPVYNTEKYLEATLQSIRNQICCEIEIIVIDDGSTDCSAEIVRRAADEDGRIVLVSQPNRGLSLARNAGIARASGEFVYFMDSDDLLEKDALETCYRKCTEQRLDFVIFDAEAFSDEGSDIPGIRYERTQGMRDRVYDGRELLALLLREGRYLPSACLSFVRLGLLRESGLRFYPDMLHEDELYTPMLYLYAARVGCIERAFFKRRVREGSIMTNRISRRNMEGYFTAFREMRFWKRSHPGDKRLVGLWFSYIVDPVIWKAHALPLRDKWRVVRAGFPYFGYVKVRTLFVFLFKR